MEYLEPAPAVVAPETPSAARHLPVSRRLVALDLLRGFDMFWILGVEELAAAIGKASSTPAARFLAEQLDHVPWQGFHFLDLIFPLFVFISGVSLVYSLTRAVESGGRKAVLHKACYRAGILYLLGLLCYGGISQGLEQVRWVGVLQRIAICGLAAAFAFCFLRPRGILFTIVGLLAGYWLLMRYVPVPGVGTGNFAEGANLANWVDFQILPGRKWDGTHDPEGLLSTLPAIATALLGVLTGIYLRNAPSAALKKSGILIGAGILLAAGGWLWHPHFPIIKKLWTSSYVLVAGGYSLVLLGAFLAVADGFGWKRWGTPFLWIGMNPIALYLSHSFIVDYAGIAERIGGGPVAAAMGAWGPVWLACLVIAMTVLLARFLHHRSIFLRI